MNMLLCHIVLCMRFVHFLFLIGVSFSLGFGCDDETNRLQPVGSQAGSMMNPEAGTPVSVGGFQ